MYEILNPVIPLTDNNVTMKTIEFNYDLIRRQIENLIIKGFVSDHSMMCHASN